MQALHWHEVREVKPLAHGENIGRARAGMATVALVQRADMKP